MLQFSVTAKEKMRCGGCGKCHNCRLYHADPRFRWLWDGKHGPMPDARDGFIGRFNAAAQNAAGLAYAGPAASGIVICGGGPRWEAGIEVTARMIRHVGCEWPIQVWHFGSRGEGPTDSFRAALAPLGVEWVDAEQILPDAHFRPGTPGGWQLKPHAILHAPFARVLLLDADCYPVAPFEHLAAHPSVFWPDIATAVGTMTPAHFAAVGLPFADDRNWETGQIFVDKTAPQQMQSLTLACWLALQPNLREYSYGDCGAFQMGWRRAEAKHLMHSGRPEWRNTAFIHRDPTDRGGPMFVHRCRDKFRQPAAGKYATPQKTGAAPKFQPELPSEVIAWQLYLRYLERQT